MLPPSYGRIDYKLDRQLMAGFKKLQEMHSSDPAAPWGPDARVLLEQKQRRVRTGPGHVSSGGNASFSPVFHDGEVTDSQVYVVLVKEVDAASVRAQEFKRMHATVNEGSPLEEIVCAIHIAEIDGAAAKASDLMYLLGRCLLAKTRKEQEHAERSTVGHELYQEAIRSVQPALF